MEIIYEDKYFLVVNKPAGLIVQGAKLGEDSLLKRLKEFLRIRENKKGEVFLGVVHRLDKVVSGVLVLAKRSKIAKKFWEIFQKGKVQKVYISLVEGKLLGEGVWENYLKWDSFKKKTLVSDFPLKDAKSATTFYKVINFSEFQSLILLSPLTGRKHQLRAILGKLGCPIVGDKKYGSQRKILNGKAILLHALYLSFLHPLTNEKMDFWAKIPPYFPHITLDKTLFWDFLYKVRKFQEERFNVSG